VDGKGFSVIPEENEVMINGEECEIVSASPTQLEILTAPYVEDIQPIYPGGQGLNWIVYAHEYTPQTIPNFQSCVENDDELISVYDQDIILDLQLYNAV
jgi:hypothetical protein